MWWLGKIVTWRETVYFLILLAGAVWGAVRWLKIRNVRTSDSDKYKALSAVYIFLGFSSAFLVYIFHLVADISAARAAAFQGLDNAPPIPIWGSLRVLEWALLIAGAVVSVFYGIQAQNRIQRSRSDEDGKDDSLLQG